MDFYKKLYDIKKLLNLTNEDLGRHIGKTGDTFRKSLNRKNLSDLEKKELSRVLNIGQYSEDGDFKKNVDEIFKRIEREESIKKANKLSEPMEYTNGYSKKKQNNKAYKLDGVPFYGSDITSTITGSFSDIPEIPEFYINIPPLNDCDAWFMNRGDSMYPKYRSGQMLAVKTINNYDAILPGESYLVITDSEANNLRTVKNVFFHPENDKLILRAKNPDFIGDTVLFKKNIISLHLVKADLDITHN